MRRALGAGRWQRAAGRPSPVRRGRILAYHGIGTPEYGVNDLRPRDFERHLQIAVDDGWSFTTPAEVIAEPDKPQLALTFDDGLASVLANALPVLRHHGIPATVFVVTGWADGQIPDAGGVVLDWRGVSALHQAGMTVASHSVTHPDFGKLEPAEARRELEVSRERLRRMLDIETSEFAIPLGQSRNWTPAAARRRPRSATRRYTHNASTPVPRAPSRARLSLGSTGRCCSAPRWQALTTIGKSGTKGCPVIPSPLGRLPGRSY